MYHSNFYFPLLCVSLLCLPMAARANELDEIFKQIEIEDSLPNADIVKDPEIASRSARYELGSMTDSLCDMQHFSLRLVNDKTGASNSYPVLLNRQSSGTVTPKEILARTTVVHVDADGSPRAYHPDDPLGKGQCEVSRSDAGHSYKGACALDNIANAGFRIFRNSQRLAGADLEQAWSSLWNQIKLKKVGSNVEPTRAGYYSFSLKDQGLTAVFNRGIIPSNSDGYPCTYSDASGNPTYFVAATSLMHAEPDQSSVGRSVAPSECKASFFLDAERVPFFVLPGGKLGDVRVGDIVVALAQDKGVERLAFGIVGDSGPMHKFGEGSIALLKQLHGKEDHILMNAAALYALDIGPQTGIDVGILILGGTKELLRGRYTRSNIEDIGKQEFSRWGNNRFNPAGRLRSCISQAKKTR